MRATALLPILLVLTACAEPLPADLEGFRERCVRLNAAPIPEKDSEGKGAILGVMVDDFARQVGKPKSGDTLTITCVGPEGHENESVRGKDLEIEYRVDPKQARLFYAVMQQVQHSRQRNGAYGWSIARDIADPELWTERYHCPTWLDYLRQRNRPTDVERALHARAQEFHIGPEPVRIRRMLERPVGSVRWKEETPDRAVTDNATIVGA